MSITLELPQALSAQLLKLDDPSGFVEAAVRREFNRQHAAEKIQALARNISSRPAAKELTDEQLEQLLDGI